MGWGIHNIVDYKFVTDPNPACLLLSGVKIRLDEIRLNFVGPKLGTKVAINYTVMTND